jgi:hypothetical protein
MGPGFAAHHFVLRRARDDKLELTSWESNLLIRIAGDRMRE